LATTTRTSFTTLLERDQRLAVVGRAANGEEPIRFAVLLHP
jgi:hypothetical protein